MELDWMKRIGIPLNATTDSMRDDTETKILEQKKEFKDFFTTTEIKKPVNENQPEKIHEHNTAKREYQKETNTNPPTRPSSRRNETVFKNSYLERATEIREDCLVSPAVTTVKKEKSVKNVVDSRKLIEATIRRKAQMSSMSELTSRISRQKSDEKEGEIWKKTILQLRLRSYPIR